jgi:hypothetical protein
MKFSMACPLSSRLRYGLALFVLLFPTVGQCGPTDTSPPSLETLQARREAARVERARWERLISIQADLAQHPNKLASSVADAAEELHSEGRSLTIEGVSMGLSSAFETTSTVIREGRKDWRTAKKLSDAATRIDATYKIFIADLAKGQKDPKKADAELEKAVAALHVAAREAPNKETREQMEALLSIGEPSIKLLSGLIRGDKRTTEEEYALMKDTVTGMRAMMLAYIQHRKPEEWIGVGKALAQKFPQFERFAGVMASTGMGLGTANFLNSVASVCVGGYAWHEGIGLEDLADDLRADQQHAAMKLQILLPHARQALASAIRREAQLDRMIASMERGNPLINRQFVPPSRRILDNGSGVPSNIYSNLPSTVAVLRNSPAMTYHLTKNEMRRREEIAKAERAAAEERARAARLAREREEREAAREREAERSSRRSSPSGDSGGGNSEPSRSSAHVDTSRVQEAINRVVNNVLPNW